MKVQLIFRPPENRTEDHWLKLWSAYGSRELKSTVVELYVFRLIPYCLAGALLTYLSLALAIFIWLSRRPQQDVGYWDVVAMPFNWEGFQAKRGRLFIEAGQQDIREGKFQEGIMKIRIGLNKYPEDRQARVFLAQVYYRAGMINPTQDMLSGGIEIGMHDQDYLTSFFQICYESDAYDSILQTIDLVMGHPDLASDPEFLYFLNRHKVTCLLELNRIEEAYALSHRINTDPDARLRMVDAEYLALVKAGKPVEALALLERWRFRLGSGNVQLQSLFVDAYTELKDDSNIRRAIRELVNIDRSNPGLHILAMQKWHQAGKQEALEDAFTSYMLLFGWDDGNLKKVNNFVTSVRAIPLIEQVLSYTRKRGMNEDVILFNLFYAYLMDGRWDEASGVLDLLKGTLDTFLPVDQKLIAIGEVIVLLKREQRDNLRLLLLQELRRLRASIPFYLTVASILGESELHDVAVDTLEQGLATFPSSKRIEKAYGEAVRTALQVTRNQKAKEVEEVLELSPDAYLEKLDVLMASGKYEEAEDLLTEIHRIGAPWLPGRSEDFEFRKLQLYFETRDAQLQTQSTSLFLSSHPDRGPELVQLAMDYLDGGKSGPSRILAEEIVRNNPRNQEARKLLEQLGGSTTNSAPDLSSRENTTQETVPLSQTKILEAMETALETRNWQATEALIQSTIRANPGWLSKNRQRFDLLHIRYYLESGNRPSASSLIRIYMGSDPKSARELLDLAKHYHNRGLDTEMNFLVEQVGRKFPNMKM